MTRVAGDDAATASSVINEIIEQQYIDGGSTLDQAHAILAAIRRGEVPGIYAYDRDFHDLSKAAEAAVDDLRAKLKAISEIAGK